MSSEYERIIKSGEHPKTEFKASIIGWKIYYNDGSIFTSKEGAWNTAKSTDIVLVVLFQEQTYPIYINGRLEIQNYRVLLDEGRYFWRQVIGGVETFGQCESTDISIPVNPKAGEIKTWNARGNIASIYNTAYLDTKWV